MKNFYYFHLANTSEILNLDINVQSNSWVVAGLLYLERVKSIFFSFSQKRQLKPWFRGNPGIDGLEEFHWKTVISLLGYDCSMSN